MNDTNLPIEPGVEAQATETQAIEPPKAAVTKTEADGDHPASHYLVVEDPEHPSTWHLRVRDADGSINHTLLGGAWAALHEGYRGNRYEGPDKAEALRKLKKLYEQEEMPLPTAAKMITFHLALEKAFGDPDDPTTLLIEGYANTGVVDRTGDRIMPDAFRAGLAAFMKNPVVLFMHDLRQPVGKVIEATIDDVGLRVKVAIDKTLEWGAKAADMIGKGILNAFSVRAINDLAAGYIDANGVRNISNWDLREISVVTVPAHQQALFSIAKALSCGTDVMENESDQLPAPVTGPSGGKAMDGQEKAPEEQVLNIEEVVAKALAQRPAPQVDTNAIAEQVMQALAARQKVADDLAAAKAAEKAAWEAELRKQWTAEQQKVAAKQTLPFPVADLGDTKDPGAQAMRQLHQIIVSSKYDRLGDLDLLQRYYLQSRAAKTGAAPRPSEQFYRATMVRAAKFMNATDDVLVWDATPGARPRREARPAFDPAVARPFVAGDEDRGDILGVDGKVVMRDVRFTDNVSAKGLAQLLEIGAKSDELVYSTQTSYGDEWVPTLMSAILWRTIRLNAAVLPLFDQFDMPSQPYDYPRESTDPTFYKVAEATDESQLVVGAQTFPDSKPGTAKTTFSAGKLGALSYWSEEMGEDSLIATEPQLRNQFGVAMAHAIDKLLIHGDETAGASETGNISYYGSNVGTTRDILVIDGLRHEALVTTTTDKRDAGTLTIDDVGATRALMGTAGVNGADPSQMVIICDVPTMLKFGGLSEVLTVDHFGPLATVLTGQLGSIMGVPLIQSQDYGLTDTSGYVNGTAGSNTVGSFLVVNRLGVKVGWRRRPRIYVGQVPFSDAWYVMGSARFDLGLFGAGMVGLSYNITV